MHSLVYRSVADDSFVLPEIYGMLRNAKEYNAEHGITGCLLYHNSHFLQLLEGEQEKVQPLFHKILRDPRHQDVQLIEKEDTQGRLFTKWSMAFHDYGLNGTSANLKMGQIDSFINVSNALESKNKLIFPFFANVKEILFS